MKYTDTQMDALIAEKVYGWKPAIYPKGHPDAGRPSPHTYIDTDGEERLIGAYCYSTDTHQAFEALAKLDKYPRVWGDGKWNVLLSRSGEYKGRHSGRHEELAMAICLACLSAVEANKEQA
jgi:hypothetical protein